MNQKEVLEKFDNVIKQIDTLLFSSKQFSQIYFEQHTTNLDYNINSDFNNRIKTDARILLSNSVKNKVTRPVSRGVYLNLRLLKNITTKEELILLIRNIAFPDPKTLMHILGLTQQSISKFQFYSTIKITDPELINLFNKMNIQLNVINESSFNKYLNRWEYLPYKTISLIITYSIGKILTMIANDEWIDCKSYFKIEHKISNFIDGHEYVKKAEKNDKAIIKGKDVIEDAILKEVPYEEQKTILSFIRKAIK